MPNRQQPQIQRKAVAMLVLVFMLLSGLALPAPAAEAQDEETHERGSRAQPPAGGWPKPEKTKPNFAPGRFVSGELAIQRLGSALPGVASAHGMSQAELARTLRLDRTLHVDVDHELVYFDQAAPHDLEHADHEHDHHEHAGAAEAEGFPFSERPAPGNEFELASLPGAAQTIYLDFTGHVTIGTSWNRNGPETINSPAYDTDGDPSTFSDSELRVVRETWASVSEDFAPWNVNVTTIDPGPEALSRTSINDVTWGVRVVISGNDFVNCQCGGVAYVGSFDDVTDEPVFVFNRGFRGVSEAATHEVGHSMLLAHDGIGEQGYYQGHSSSDTPGWAPIMGSSYFQQVSQWSQQEYAGANNVGGTANFDRGADDIAILSSLTNGNGFGLKTDDHGAGADATSLIDGTTTVGGLIESRDDRDEFSFTTGGGMVSFIAAPAAVSPNLDIELILRDEAGVAFASANESRELGAQITVTLPPGDYVLSVNGVGVGAPTSTPASGYSDYGSIGHYTVTPSIEAFGGELIALGDVNCDGALNVLDALAIAQYTSQIREGAPQCATDGTDAINTAMADVNNDNAINVFDAVVVSQCVASVPNVLCPAGEG